MSISVAALPALLRLSATMVLLLAISGNLAAETSVPEDFDQVLGHPIPAMDECFARLIEQPAGTKTDVRDIDQAARVIAVCYDKLRYQGLINDFQIRRAKFAVQYSSERVILWMVVVLTISGVILAGLQLLGTYRLAIAGRPTLDGTNSELAVEQGKLVLRSSVTGLFILLISFAFFYVYVFEVFTIQEIGAKTTVSQEAQNKNALPMRGTLSPPPDNSADAASGAAPDAQSD